MTFDWKPNIYQNHIYPITDDLNTDVDYMP